MSKKGSLKKYLPWEVSLKEDHPHSKYKTGTIWPTKEWGNIKIIGQCDIPYISPVDGRKRYMWYLVEFSDGVQVVAERPHIASGKVKNPYQPSIYEVGFMGQGKYSKTSNPQENTLWLGMLGRCYSEDFLRNFPTYRDCIVAERWHNFQNFCEDIKHLEGYAGWKNNTTKRLWDLDKDIKIKGNKVYSKSTCMFVTQKANCTEAGLTGKTYIATRLKDGYTEEFVNQSAFARKYGWYKTDKTASKGICRVLKGGANTYKGWTFKIKENV